MSPLERRYRRLVRVYPPGPRRDELLFTLLDCAPPGRRHPDPRQVAAVLRHGARARLGRPRSRSVVVLATLATVVLGVFGAAAASVLGWQFAPSLAGVAQARGIDRLVFPGMNVLSCANSDEVYAEDCADVPPFIWNPDREGTRYGFYEYVVVPTDATRDHLAFTDGVRQRLQARGWRMGSPVREHPGVDDLDTSVLDGTSADPGDATREATFWATKDGLVLEFFDAVDPTGASTTDPQLSARFTLARAAPWWLRAMTVAGALLGAAGGWLFTGWVSRRTAANPAGTFLAAAPAWLVSVPLLLSVLPLNEQVGRPWEEGLFVGLHAKLAPWPDLGFDPINPVAGMALFALLPALLAGILTRPAQTAARTAK